MYGLKAGGCGYTPGGGCCYIINCFNSVKPSAIDSMSFSIFLDILSMFLAYL